MDVHRAGVHRREGPDGVDRAQQLRRGRVDDEDLPADSTRMSISAWLKPRREVPPCLASSEQAVGGQLVHDVGDPEALHLVGFERQLGGRAQQVRFEDVGFIGVEYRRLHRLAQQRLGWCTR